MSVLMRHLAGRRGANRAEEPHHRERSCQEMPTRQPRLAWRVARRMDMDEPPVLPCTHCLELATSGVSTACHDRSAGPSTQKDFGATLLGLHVNARQSAWSLYGVRTHCWSRTGGRTTLADLLLSLGIGLLMMLSAAVAYPQRFQPQTFTFAWMTGVVSVTFYLIPPLLRHYS